MEPKRIVLNILILLSLVLIWQITYNLHLYPELLWPSPIEILEAVYDKIISGYLLTISVNSLAVLTIGFAFSCLVAFLCVFLMYCSKTLEDLVNIFTAALHPIPGVVWMPFALLWFGLSIKTVIFVIFQSTFFPMVVNMWTGFTYVNKQYIEIARILKLNRAELLIRVLLPASLPYVLTGLRVGLARAWRTLIAVEVILVSVGEFTGLGEYIWESSIWLNTKDVIVGMATISIIGYSIEKLLFSQIERRSLKRWMPTPERAA